MTRRPLVITTQPGWAFSTLAEIRAGGGEEHLYFHHRDSTLSCRNGLYTPPRTLKTPAEVFGEVLSTTAGHGDDASRRLLNLMRPESVRRAVLDWLPAVEGTRPRRYNVTCEALGRTFLRRHDLAEVVDQAIRSSFRGWRRSSAHGVRIFCKADPTFAFVGVQLHSNLGDDGPGRPGALRRHLACSLLQLAGVDANSTVLDLFMGTGTILDTALRLYKASAAVGFEVDAGACDIAKARLAGQNASIFHASFETLDIGLIDSQTRLVTNVPFGVQFQRVDTVRLLPIIRACYHAGAGIAMLTSREQGSEVSASLRLRRKNVIVMGQPASILYGIR